MAERGGAGDRFTRHVEALSDLSPAQVVLVAENVGFEVSLLSDGGSSWHLVSLPLPLYRSQAPLWWICMKSQTMSWAVTK